MITKRELRKLAILQVSGVLQSMDLGILFGEELFDLGYEPNSEWIHDFLAEIQKEMVLKVLPKQLRT